GDVVQAYWSAKDQAYIVPDGYAQTTYDEPQWLTDSSGNLIFDSAGNPTFLALKEVSGTQVVGIEGLQGLSPGQALPPGNTVWFNDGTQDLYYQAVTDSDQNININESYDGTNFFGQFQLLGDEKARGNPSLAVYDGKLYIAWTGTDHTGLFSH